MSKRDELLKRLSKFKFLPGHGLNTDEATDEQLEDWANFLESLWEKEED